MEYSFLYGMDVSSLLSLEHQGAHFYDQSGSEKELLVILKEAGVESIRLRLWVDPKTIDGKPYAGGDNDLDSTLTLAKRAYSLGFSIVLDLHYSDFWADPGKQTMPKAWANLSFSELVRIVYLYTNAVLLRFDEAKIPLAYIQVGNEITNGMLWPQGMLYDTEGKLIPGSHERLSALLNAGIKAVRERSPLSRVIIHLDRGGDAKLYKEFFAAMYPLLSPFDVIGLSYYPYWHGTLSDLSANVNFLKAHYAEDIMIMETSYAFDGEASHGPFVVTKDKTPCVNGFPPYTKEGQAQYLAMLLAFVRDYEVDGLFYWEPAWIPLPGDSWATREAMVYMNENEKTVGNEWANQALFDYTGHALPALYVYNNFVKGDEKS